LTGICRKIDKIYSERVNDLSPYGGLVMETQGIGITPEAFEQGLKDGTVVGHIGFPQSVMMISDALGLGLDEIREERTPIIAKKERKGKHIVVAPGMVAGCRHTVKGFKNGKTLVELVHPQQIEPEAEGNKTWDYIRIEGDPGVDLRVEPEIAGGTGTAAIAVNMAPLVTAAKPGLRSMIDLPVPRMAALKK
jgi:4-hydroxy-tetrahydrodipicolinate reductase